MDWLHQVKDAVEQEIFGQVANLLSLEVDLLFSGTTSTCFEADEDDEAVPRDKNGNLTDDEQKAAEGKAAGFRAYGKSKDHRDDLPQVVIGMAVTRDGVVRIWCWPGNTADSALIRQVKDDMRARTQARVVWVADRGFTSAANRRYLRSGDHHYIIGEKLRSGSAEAQAALSRQGRYQDVAQNLRAKEVRISDSERFVICYNPKAAERDAKVRERMLARLAEVIAGIQPPAAGEAGTTTTARVGHGHAGQVPLTAAPPGSPTPVLTARCRLFINSINEGRASADARVRYPLDLDQRQLT